MQEKAPIVSTENAAITTPKIVNNVKDQISFLQSLLAFVVSLSFLASFSGYIIFTAHLYQYTDIPHLSVKPIYYLVSGFILFMILNGIIISIWFHSKLIQGLIWLSQKILSKSSWRVKLPLIGLFLLGLSWIIYAMLTPEGSHAFLITLLLGGIFLFAFIIISWRKQKSINKGVIDEEKLLPTQENILNIFKENPFNILTSLLIILSLVMFLFISSSVGINTYRMFSSDMGGGKPTTSAIIFNDAAQLQRLGLLSISETQTATICFLAELEGGYLVYEPSTQRALSIPNQAIAAIVDDGSHIDCSPPNRSLPSQSIPLGTPEATPDIQPTSTP